MFGEEEILKAHKPRAQIIIYLIIAALGIILARLWYLQVYKGDLFYQYSLQNRLRKELIRSPRGKFYDRNGELIVDNVPRFDAVLTPQYLKGKKKVIKKIANILEISQARVKKTIRKHSSLARYKSIIIKKNISRREVALIETELDDLPGISVDTFISRQYFDNEIGAHLLGYISEISKKQLPKYRKRDDINYKLGDFIGQFGLEEQFDRNIRGHNGYEFVEVDARGRKKRNINNKIFSSIQNLDAAPGDNLELTIDRELQRKAYEALKDKVGSAVAIDIHSGEILAMVSRPSFQPSQFSRGLSSKYWGSLVNDTRNPLRDRTIQEHYSPGSTFKAITAIAVLEEGLINERTELPCKGSFKLGRKRYHCWKRWGHGKVALTKAIRESCNIYFQRLASKIDIDVLAKYAKMFGFGMKTGINLPREISGLIPTREWKKQKTGVDWQLGETLSCAIGQSFVLSTPLQLALAYSAVANGGTIYRPYLIKRIFDNENKSLAEFNKEMIREIKVSKKTLDAVRKGLYQVVNKPKGTAWWRRGRGIQMAGKTGTSQVVRSNAETLYQKCEEKKYEFRHHALFVGFAPYKNPKIAVASLVEHGCHGSSAAAPVVASIIEKYMQKYHPEVYEQNIVIDKGITQKWLREREKKLEEKKLEQLRKETEENEI